MISLPMATCCRFGVLFVDLMSFLSSWAEPIMSLFHHLSIKRWTLMKSTSVNGSTRAWNISSCQRRGSQTELVQSENARMATISIIPGLWIVSRSLGFSLLASPWISHWLFGLRRFQWLHTGMRVLIKANPPSQLFNLIQVPHSGHKLNASNSMADNCSDTSLFKISLK